MQNNGLLNEFEKACVLFRDLCGGPGPFDNLDEGEVRTNPCSVVVFGKLIDNITQVSDAISVRLLYM